MVVGEVALEPIGKGGMGEVYRGIDTRLGRPVAIKISAREFNDRFEREARAISSLNHPNICTLYDVGPNYLVMEFVGGDTLSKIVEQGPMPLDKGLAVGRADRGCAGGRACQGRDPPVGQAEIQNLDAVLGHHDFAGLQVAVTAPMTGAGAVLGTIPFRRRRATGGCGQASAQLRCSRWRPSALWPKPVPARSTGFQVSLPEGHKLVFNANGAQSGLWIRDLDTLEWRRLEYRGREIAVLVSGQPIPRVRRWKSTQDNRCRRRAYENVMRLDVPSRHGELEPTAKARQAGDLPHGETSWARMRSRRRLTECGVVTQLPRLWLRLVLIPWITRSHVSGPRPSGLCSPTLRRW